MPEAELEQVMVDFVAQRFDLLLATTIVESGLDIPNANTIFIDQADRYGLADLHQLRGRVGRYKHRAYCYLLVEPNRHLSPNAARRLQAIEEFSDMGAGFVIAMRDLELRGAGNLLGTQQSGHIAAVGYELYCQLLDNAVRRLKKLPPKTTVEVTVDLPGEAFIPQHYVPDLRLKIDLYRRIARVGDEDQVQQLRQELYDRFGPPPPPVERILDRCRLKLDAAHWQLNSIHQEERYLVFGFCDRSRVQQLAKTTGGALRIVDQRSAYLTLPTEVTRPDAILEVAKSVLRPG
jgi:transcription-repair coupling factor (superfamily II helicase)